MLLFLGDVHGEFNELSEKIVRTEITNASIIQVGDFGVGFRKQEVEELQRLNSILIDANTNLYVVRGNHDDPSFFSGKTAFSKIVFLKDYTLLNIQGLSILLVGGAVSVDRSRRTVGTDYWTNEAFVYDEEYLTSVCAHVTELDIVVTHNAPSEFWPFAYENLVFRFAQRDASLLADLAKDRNNHSKLLNQLKVLNRLPKTWYYGHFHASHRGVYQNIKYALLNCAEFLEHWPQTVG